jgi:hypothetical protein
MMKVLTKQEVLKRIEEFCKPYVSYAAAAEAFGCTPAQLSDARNDRAPVCPAILKKLRISRERLYVVELEGKYKDGSMSL